jgi:serine/threonine protein kinase, bacterial
MNEVEFGRYRLIELLGRGGMGEVWRAHDTDTDRIVAIKVLPVNFSENEDFKQRFRREAHAAARLNTPHVVPIHNYGEIDGRLYVDMRLVEGRDLQAVLADGPMEPGRAVRIIEGIALALHAAHKVGLLHRDVKPSNILLDEDDCAYLNGFGIASAADETRLSKSGNTIGTFAYIAPERLGSRAEEDARADIYSLACVLYECLTGSPPFDEATMAQLVAAHLHTPPPHPSTARAEVPGPFDEVIATGMAKDPDQRYATTVELASAAHDAITTPIPRPAQNLRTPASSVAKASVVNPAPPTSATEATAQQQPADLNLAATQQRPPGGPPVPQPRPADRPPPQIGTPTPQPWWRRQRREVKLGLIAAIVVILAGAGTTGYLLWPNASRQTWLPQTVLPFTGLDIPIGVAVDRAGNVYVADAGNNRVVQLAAGSSAPTVLPFTGLNKPVGVAVDTAGNVYVADKNNRVVTLAAGSSSQSVLPFTGLRGPHGVAVDSARDLYVTDFGNNRVVKLAAGSAIPTVLPSTGLNGPEDVAVDTAGNLYVTDAVNNRVLKLAAGSSTQTELPFTDRKTPYGVAVDSAGNLYVTDAGNRVLSLAAGSSSQSVLPFTGLNGPDGVAVDTAGNLYVTDVDNNRVLELAAGSSAPTALPFTGLSHPVGVAVDTGGTVYVANFTDGRINTGARYWD